VPKTTLQPRRSPPFAKGGGGDFYPVIAKRFYGALHPCVEQQAGDFSPVLFFFFK